MRSPPVAAEGIFVSVAETRQIAAETKISAAKILPNKIKENKTKIEKKKGEKKSAGWSAPDKSIKISKTS